MPEGDAPGLHQRLGIRIGGVDGFFPGRGAAVPAPTDHEAERNPGPQAASAQGVPRFHEAGVLDENEGLEAARPEAGGDGDGLTLAGGGDEGYIGVFAHSLVEHAALGVGDCQDMSKAERFERLEGFRCARTLCGQWYLLVK